MQSTWSIGWVNKVGPVWNLIVIVIFVIWFPVGSINDPETNKSHNVWTSLENTTDWPTGWATIMGFLTAIYTMSGFDAPFHLSEEARDANIAGPRAIIMTAQTGLYLGFAIMSVIIYTVKDVTDVVAGQYGQPFGSLCLQVLGQRAGLAMFALNIIAQLFCGQCCLVACTRIIFAFERDGAIPFSSWFAYVNKRTLTPVNATWGITVVAAALGTLLSAGPVAIGAVFSVGAIAQYTAFTFPIALKLFFNHGRFRHEPWHLGKWSMPVNGIAVACCLLTVPALCWPAYQGGDLTLQTMNWTCLMFGGPVILVLVYWTASARKWFKGSRINTEHVNTIGTVAANNSSDDVARKEAFVKVSEKK